MAKLKLRKAFLDQVEDILLASSRQAVTKPLKILLVGVECTPYANVGGMARIISSLARALIKRGHDARIFIPKFGLIDEEKYPLEPVYEGLNVLTDDEKNPYLTCNVKRHQARGYAPVYFLENREYYELRANVYGYQDDHIRWILFSRGVLTFLAEKSDWIPDVIHANDWHSGHIPNYLRTIYDEDDRLLQTASLFSIHNLYHQGLFDHKNVSDLDFDDGRSPIASFFRPRLKNQNFMRRGIIYAEIVSTVSKTYAKEILRPEYGEGLDRLLTEVRAKLHGVLNGIDYEEFNPATDQFISTNYDAYTLEKRSENKKTLQEEFDLPVDESIPVIAYSGRMDQQKGVDLIVEVMQPLLKDFKVQFIGLGGGDTVIMDGLRWLRDQFPDKVGVHLMPDFTLPRLIFSGSDMMLMPSRFEPCGIVQMEAMRYGAVPIVRATGGLADTVANYDPYENVGTGFVFSEFNGWSLFAQIVRALETYRQKEAWKRMQRRAMLHDNSWEARAQEYEGLYQRAMGSRREELISEGEIERSVAQME